MQPIKIINSTLQKPWLLIACYDVSFDNYLSIHGKLEKLCERLRTAKAETVLQAEVTLSQLRGQLENISQNLRHIDEMIHDYIRTHQK